MLEKVNNLAIVGGNARRLDEEERGAILAALRTQKTLSWPGVRRVLQPNLKARGESAKTLRFNLEAGDQEGGLKGNIVEADLATSANVGMSLARAWYLTMASASKSSSVQGPTSRSRWRATKPPRHRATARHAVE